MTWLLNGRWVALSAVFTACLLFWTGKSIRAAAESMNQAMVERSMVPVIGMLENAHRAKDDVALQRLIQLLAQAPGVTWAGVLDAQDKGFLVHGESARIGSAWDPSNDRLSWNARLGDAEAPWGRLTVGLANAENAHFHRQIAVWGIISAMGFVLFAMLQAGYAHRQATTLRDEKADVTAALEECKQVLLKLQNQIENQQTISGQCLQSALEQIVRPCLLLNGQQKVVACNSVAAKLLEFKSARDVVGLSWQDVPMLAPCGRILGESLENPERTFRMTLESVRLTLDWWTLPALEGRSPGTWVTISP